MSLHQTVLEGHASMTDVAAAPPRAGFVRPWESVDSASVSPPPAPEPVVELATAAPVASASTGSTGRAIDPLLFRLIETAGSDLHLQADSVPRCRIHGTMVDLPGYEGVVIAATELAEMLFEMVGPKKEAQFLAEWDLDTAYSLSADHRFRVNLMRDRGKVGAVLRVIPNRIKPLSELGLPAGISRFTQLHRGLVLVTGPTGSGKSTTLAALVDLINKRDRKHIITLEDPIEFTHKSDKSTVRQREIGSDVSSFQEGLRRALREDPDVILLGELRDKDTVETAIMAAETGHLVMGTLHTSSAKETVSRIIGVFPSDQQDQVRTQIADSLMGVVCQTLCKRRDGGRIAAIEMMVTNAALRNNIRLNQLAQIDNVLVTGATEGQLPLNVHLYQLVNAGLITTETALLHSHDTRDMQGRLGATATVR